MVSESKRNTESLRSFLVALNGRKIPSLGNIGYRLSFMRQAKGVGNAANENSVAAAVFTSFGLGGDVTFAPLLEVVHRTGVGDASDTDRSIPMRHGACHAASARA